MRAPRAIACRPFHVAVFDVVAACLATSGTKLIRMIETGARTAGTFQHNGQRYTVTVALAEEHIDEARAQGKGST